MTSTYELVIVIVINWSHQTVLGALRVSHI